ncbi:MAG: hypothetical protein V7K21_20520 [Nostoc sp.]
MAKEVSQDAIALSRSRSATTSIFFTLSICLKSLNPLVNSI